MSYCAELFKSTGAQRPTCVSVYVCVCAGEAEIDLLGSEGKEAKEKEQRVCVCL